MNMGSGVDKALADLHERQRRHQVGTTLERYADSSMFEAVPMEKAEDGEIEPVVTLLWMTPDPLGAIAAACRMYEGIPTYKLSDITDDERRRYFDDVQRTHLTAPMEFVKLHYFIEGVDRGFTHQIVRQRTAVFAQESLRFAVKDHMAEEVVIPPSVAELPAHHPTRQMWEKHLKGVQDFYNYLIANDIPAEDARSILPHAVATRLNFCTDLRNLREHAGNRLCTQAQMHWRDVFTQIKDCIATFTPDFSFMDQVSTRFGTEDSCRQKFNETQRWQFELLANSGIFKPACYQQGHCPFKASFDRGCTIRERVDMNAKRGRGSGDWPYASHDRTIPAIDDREWQLDRKAAFQ